MDPIFASAAVTDPQQWNRYAYARNNPLKWVDPSGLCVDTTIDGKTYCVSESVVVHGESSGDSGFFGLFWNGTAWCEPGFNQGVFYGFFNCVDRPSDGGGDSGGSGDNGGGGGGRRRPVPVADTAPAAPAEPASSVVVAAGVTVGAASSPAAAAVVGVAAIGYVIWEKWDQITATFERLANWTNSVLQTNRDENAVVREIADRVGLSRHERDLLHREISKGQYTREEIEAIARGLKSDKAPWERRNPRW